VIRNFLIIRNFVTKGVSSLTVSFYFVHCYIYTGMLNCSPLLGKFFLLVPADWWCFELRMFKLSCIPYLFHLVPPSSHFYVHNRTQPVISTRHERAAEYVWRSTGTGFYNPVFIPFRFCRNWSTVKTHKKGYKHIHYRDILNVHCSVQIVTLFIL
jgi:hypothetical protein